MNDSTRVLFRFSQALSLYTAFGKYRDSFPDHYDEEKNIYIAECSDKTKRLLEKGASQEGFFLFEWTDKLLPGEKKERGLITVEGRDYFAYEECKDISQSTHFTSFLAGVDFTNAVQETLSNVETLFYNHHDNDFDAQQLLAHFRQDGTYIVDLQYEGMANHAFLLLKEAQTVSLIHRQKTLIAVTRNTDDFIGLFQACANNPSLISCLFGTAPYFGAKKPVKFNSIRFSPDYPCQSAVINHLQNMATTYFAGRPEYNHIQELLLDTI